MDVKKASELFWATFIGEHVELLAEFDTGSKSAPLTVIGYLIDIDDTYYYIGSGPLVAESVIQKSKVIFISLLDKTDEATRILEEMPIPEDPLDEQ